ncbi:hypothetical protein ABBQ38_010034 [Trebouxia sp. C0009 RCD-2024]
MGAPDVGLGLQAALALATATDSTYWDQSLAKTLLDALSHVKTMAHNTRAGNIEAVVHAMEPSDYVVKDLSMWKDCTHWYAGLCFTV